MLIDSYTNAIFTEEGLRSLCKNWRTFDEAQIKKKSDYDEVIIFHNNLEYHIGSYKEFFALMKNVIF